MDNKELTERFKDLLTVNQPQNEISKLFNTAVNSGLLSFENEEADSFRTSKIMYHAILSEMAEHWKPLDSFNYSESQKLKNYLKKLNQ